MKEITGVKSSPEALQLDQDEQIIVYQPLMHVLIYTIKYLILSTTPTYFVFVYDEYLIETLATFLSFKQ